MIGDMIKQYRIEHDLTQAELAEKVEVNPATVSSWEVNRTEPNIKQLSNLSKLFGIQVDELIAGTKNRRVYSVDIPGVNVETVAEEQKNETGSDGLNLYAKFLKYCELPEEKRKMVDAYIDFIKTQ